MKKLTRYFHTLRFLKFKQIAYRLKYRFFKVKPKEIGTLQRRELCLKEWVSYELGSQKIFSGFNCRFLNHDGHVTSKDSWNDNNYSKLWLYNLHYFDDLCSQGAVKRRLEHKEWMDRWIEDNPIGHGNGWESYPTSLRTVNWMKAFLSGFPTTELWMHSLSNQLNYLESNLEYHLLGNHLFANAKALLFGGCFFEGKIADSWRKAAIDIIECELDEQVLADGTNFELTPMYHAIILVDILDLINLSNICSESFPSSLAFRLREKASAMLTVLKALSHPDEKISFFNDSTFGIAPENSQIFQYASRLGLSHKCSFDDKRFLYLQDSGYLSVKYNRCFLIADLGEIGPSYLPGHAHADTLSFELSLDDKRFIVNSGISEYGISDERLRQRKTAAHNTVSVDNLDSSEVWSGFRVARRASIVERVISSSERKFSATHNGFKGQGVNCLHRREWSFNEASLTIIDELIGKANNAIGYFHFHPSLKIVVKHNKCLEVSLEDIAVNISFEGADFVLETSTWHPEFGLSIPNKVLLFTFCKNKVVTRIEWNLS
ncbi:MAG: alginate lyase family protein [Oceanospirillaceae bacterium]|nr:alginate lyase family protein [Oceanospirillaceae bacterium]